MEVGDAVGIALGSVPNAQLTSIRKMTNLINFIF